MRTDTSTADVSCQVFKNREAFSNQKILHRELLLELFENGEVKDSKTKNIQDEETGKIWKEKDEHERLFGFVIENFRGVSCFRFNRIYRLLN